MSSKAVPLSSLVEDLDALYPRHAIDSAHVSALARALQTGAKLPVIVVDKKSLRIIDGLHRKRAYQRVMGPQAEIEVDLRAFASEADMVRAAVELNATHGRRLDAQDMTKCALMLERHGLKREQIALTLHTTEPHVERLLVRVVVVAGTRLPVKPILWPKEGEKPREVTSVQYEIAQGASGWRTQQTVTQLTRELSGDVLNMEDAALVEALWKLHDAIEKKVPALSPA